MTADPAHFAMSRDHGDHRWHTYSLGEDLLWDRCEDCGEFRTPEPTVLTAEDQAWLDVPGPDPDA